MSSQALLPTPYGLKKGVLPRGVCRRWSILTIVFLGGLSLTARFLGPSLSDEFRARAAGWRTSTVVEEEEEQVPVIPSPWHSRAQQVKAAFVRAYAAYESAAEGHDELLPLNNSFTDNFNGWSVTMVDSLDTMWLMGLHDLFNASLPRVASLRFNDNKQIPFFETVIRYVGGLLSAYALSGRELLLTRADDLAAKLLPVFNTTSGLPSYSVNTATGTMGYGWMGSFASLAEMASCQLEFRYLAHLTGRAEYAVVADSVSKHMERLNLTDGLYPQRFSQDTGAPSYDKFAIGAGADSAYEYLLKGWLQTGKTEPRYLDMYLKSADGIIDNLLYLSPQRHLLYATDVWANDERVPSGQHEHLSCFLAGLLALGYANSAPREERHLYAAQGLAHTCWLSYADTATGLGAEAIFFQYGKEGTRWAEAMATWERAEGMFGPVPPGVLEAEPIVYPTIADLPVWNDTTPRNDAGAVSDLLLERREFMLRDARYMLRPETMESFYLLWRTTGDEVWREHGWTVFEAIRRHAATQFGFASVVNVDSTVAETPLMNEMPSFFLAETLKYAYLLFTDEDLVPLDKWVFNTEAHPLPIFEWDDWQKVAFGIGDGYRPAVATQPPRGPEGPTGRPEPGMDPTRVPMGVY